MELKAGTYLSFSSLAKLHSPSRWGTCCHPAACPPTAHTDIEECSHQVDSWIHGAQSQSSHLVQFLDPVLSEVFNLSQLLEHLLQVDGIIKEVEDNTFNQPRTGSYLLHWCCLVFLIYCLSLSQAICFSELVLKLPNCSSEHSYHHRVLSTLKMNKILKCCTRMKLSLLVSYLYWGLKQLLDHL